MITNLVIGSEGFIGQPFCRFLKKRGEKVIPFDAKRDASEDGRIYKFDFKDIDKVYFLAWDVGGSKYLYKSDLQMHQLKWNLALMENIFEQIGKSKVPFMFASSQLVEEYDTVYGVTKKLGEVWADLLGGVSVRIWNAYGYMEKMDVKSHVISDFIYQALTKGKIQMMTSGEEWRQFTHIEDLSRAFYASLHTKNLRRSVYDASSYEWVRIIDIAKMISDLTGAKVIPGKTKGHDPLPADNMGRIPHWHPQIELEAGVKKMINQARKNLNNVKSKE